jgi:hypothetical protein
VTNLTSGVFCNTGTCWYILQRKNKKSSVHVQYVLTFWSVIMSYSCCFANMLLMFGFFGVSCCFCQCCYCISSTDDQPLLIY